MQGTIRLMERDAAIVRLREDELIREELSTITLDTFEADRPKRLLVERGIEIISEVSRYLSAELKARHLEIP